MTTDVERFAFLLRQKPICTQSPIKSALGPELHRELRAKYKLELGLDLLEDRCPNAFNCIAANSGCIGRPLPMDESILRALQNLNVRVSEGDFKGRRVYLATAVVTCSGCPFAGQCDTSCVTQDSYLSRTTRPEANPPENSLVTYDDFEKGLYTALIPDDVQHCDYGDWADQELPLDCLTPRQLEIIDMLILRGLDQVEVAGRLGKSQQAVAKNKRLALARLEEFGKARALISKSLMVPLRVREYYLNNRTSSQIAAREGVSRQAVDSFLRRWRETNLP